MADNAVDRYDIYPGHTTLPAPNAHPSPNTTAPAAPAASNAARKYFASFPPAVQATILASWGGNDRMQEWFDNAVAAGAVSSTGSNDYTGNTTTPENATEQQRVATLPPGTFADDSPDAGKLTGDPYLDELRSGKYAGAEDWRRFSNAQLLAWKGYYQGNGQFKNKYGDIVGKPDDTGPNTPSGYNGTGDYFGGGGGGGGAQQAAASASASANPTTPANTLSQGLSEAFTNKEGIFGNNDPFAATARTLGDPSTLKGSLLANGGMWWGQPGYNEGGTAPAAIEEAQPNLQPSSISGLTLVPSTSVSGGSVSSPNNPSSVWATPEMSPLAQAVANQYTITKKRPWWQIESGV